MNVMPITTLKKLGKSKSNLIFTNMKMTNFTNEVIDVVGVLVADIIVGLRHSAQCSLWLMQTHLFYFIRKRLDSFQLISPLNFAPTTHVLGLREGGSHAS